MAINWVAAFKLIPWSDVVQAAPTIVRGARDLWIRTRKAGARSVRDGAAGEGSIEADGIAHLAQRIAQLESGQLETSALINTLAGQSAQLVAALDNLRMRMRVLSAVCVLLALGSVAAWLR